MKKAIIIISIILAVFFAAYFSVRFVATNIFSDEGSYHRLDKDADVLVVYEDDEINSENPKQCIVISNKPEIKDYLGSHRWSSHHMICSGWPEYNIVAVKGDDETALIYGFESDITNYNTDLVQKTNKYIDRFKTASEFSCKYIMTAPLSTDYDTLRSALQDTEHFIVFSHDSTPKYSSFSLEYTEQESNYEHLDFPSAIHEEELGKFEPDNIFLPIIAELKADGLYVSNTKVHNPVSGGGLFTRRIDIYISEALDTATVEKYETMWSAATKYEPHFMANEEFTYYCPQAFAFTIISDHKLTNAELEHLNSKYTITLQSVVQD